MIKLRKKEDQVGYPQFGNKIELSLIVLCLALVFVLVIDIPYTGLFIFENNVNRYDFDELPNSFEIKLNEEFNLNIDINEEGDFVFSDDSDIFDIDRDTGIISFVPNEVGEFKVVVIALKDVDNFYYKLINFVVIE